MYYLFGALNLYVVFPLFRFAVTLIIVNVSAKDIIDPFKASPNWNTVPAPIQDAASIQEIFLSLRTMIHFTQNRLLAYSKNK